MIMERFHPDNLVPGSMYRIRFEAIKGYRTIRGRFLRMEASKDKEGSILWLYFKTAADPELPIDYHPDLEMQLIEEVAG